MKSPNYKKNQRTISRPYVRWFLLCFVIMVLGSGCSPRKQENSSDKHKEGLSLYGGDKNDLNSEVGYTILGEDKDKAIDRIDVSILVGKDITEAEITSLLGKLGNSYKALHWHVVIWMFTSKEHYDSGMKYFAVADIHLMGDDPPEMTINRDQLEYLRADPIEKFGLSEDKRKEIFMEIVSNEYRASIEAMKTYPFLDDRNPEWSEEAASEQRRKQYRLKDSLYGKFRNELAQKYGLARDQLDEINVEGGLNKWPFPPSPSELNELFKSSTLQDSAHQAKEKQAVTLEANSAGVSTSSGEPVKFDGALMENNQLKVFIFQGGKMSSIKAGDYVCGGEVIQVYSPGEPDGIAPGQNVVQLDYRIKVRFPDGEKVFKNGDVICEGSEDISQQISDPGMSSGANDSGAVSGHPPTANKDAPGMDQVRNAQESFRKAQEAEHQGLYKRASFFYERAVEHAQWSLAYVIEGQRDGMKAIIGEGEQKRKDLSGKEDRDASAAESALVRDTDVRPAGALIFGLDTPREIMNWMHENIKYKTEKKGFGDRSDRWQTPEETIVAGGGDCEDNAFLSQALLKGIGIDSYVIEVRWGFTDIHSHAICVFPRKNPKDYFDNDQLITSNNNIMKTLFRTYPKWQRIYILDFKTRTGNLILERKLWTYERMGGEKNELLIKDFLGEEG